MADFKDKIKNKAKAATGDSHARLEELRRKHEEGKIDDKEREEMVRLQQEVNTSR